MKEVEKKGEKKVVKKKKQGMVGFFIEMVLIFIAFTFIMGLGTIFIADLSSFTKYHDAIISEIVYMLFAFIIIIIYDNTYVFKEKKEKLSKSLYLGLPMLLFSIIMLVSNVIYVGIPNFDTVKNIIMLIPLCFFIGLFEEFLFRGWIQNEFIEKFGNTSKGRFLSILLASLVFGVVHVINVLGGTQGLFESILQALNAIACGFFLGCVYYRTKNIFGNAILHGFYDFALMYAETKFLGDCISKSNSTEAVLLSVGSVALLLILWVVGSAFVLCHNAGNKILKTSASGERKFLVLSVIAVLLASSFSILEFVLPDTIDTGTVCYEYKEKEVEPFEFVSYLYEDYELTNDNDTLKIVTDKKQIVPTVEISNVNNRDRYTFKNSNIYQVHENENDYVLVFLDENDIYYYKLSKNNLGLSLKDFEKKFTKYTFPSVEHFGFLRYKDSNEYYPYILSKAGDMFAIESDGKLYRLLLNE